MPGYGSNHWQPSNHHDTVENISFQNHHLHLLGDCLGLTQFWFSFGKQDWAEICFLQHARHHYRSRMYRQPQWWAGAGQGAIGSPSWTNQGDENQHLKGRWLRTGNGLDFQCIDVTSHIFTLDSQPQSTDWLGLVETTKQSKQVLSPWTWGNRRPPCFYKWILLRDVSGSPEN